MFALDEDDDVVVVVVKCWTTCIKGGTLSDLMESMTKSPKRSTGSLADTRKMVASHTLTASIMSRRLRLESETNWNFCLKRSIL